MPKRIIPCLDVKDGKVVKGKSFTGLVEAGDPIEMARFYSEEGADELVFLDISASEEGRQTVVDLVRRMADEVDIPFCVGGGISSLEVMERLFEAGADKLSINTPAVMRPALVREAARVFGNKITVAIDAQWNDALEDWEVHTHGGKRPTGKRATTWAVEVEDLGAGEILLTSIGRDGMKDGYDLKMISALVNKISIPVIASGGAGTLEHFAAALKRGGADAVLAASVFHNRIFSVREVKEYLQHRGIEVFL
ncbi:MAG: imidazole glycerol phosphate synthase subunit HisF [Dethiobacteria bacterium]